MNLEKFTERSREFIQSAQAAALAAEHQRILPQHLLKVILEDEQDFAKNLQKSRNLSKSSKICTTSGLSAKYDIPCPPLVFCVFDVSTILSIF